MTSSSPAADDGQASRCSSPLRALNWCRARLISVPVFFRQLAATFGWRFLALLGLAQVLLKGFAYSALLFVQLPLFKDYFRVDVTDYQRYYVVSDCAWALKGAVGITSDNWPLFGFHKRYYIVFLACMGAVAVALCALLPAASATSATFAAALLFVSFLAIAGQDVLCEGKYSELMVKKKETGSSLVSFVWLAYALGSTTGAIFEGVISDLLDPRIVLWICSVVLLALVVPALKGWIPDDEARELPPLQQVADDGHLVLLDARREQSSAAHAPRETAASESLAVSCASQLVPCCSRIASQSAQHKKTMLLAAVVSAAGLTLAILTLTANHYVLLGYILVTSVAIIVAAFRLLPRAAAMVLTFVFLQEIFYLEIDSVLSYYYTADEQCVPGGPQFSLSYYQSFGNVAANLAGLLGVVFFESFLSSRSYRTAVYWVTCLQVVSSIFDLALVTRFNIDVLGISDYVFYAFGDAVINPATVYLAALPAVTLMSSVCEEGCESTMYALLAAFSNFAQSASRSFCYLLAGVLSISTFEDDDDSGLSSSGSSGSATSCNFNNLWLLILVGHMIMPLLTIPAAWFAVPDVPITGGDVQKYWEGDRKNEKGDDGATPTVELKPLVAGGGTPYVAADSEGVRL